VKTAELADDLKSFPDYHTQAEGTEEEILIEGVREKSGQPFGRTRGAKIVNINTSSDFKLGDLVDLKIIKGLKHSLVGELLE
jgi:tRNA A37 methylthiotransferase MiaB